MKYLMVIFILIFSFNQTKAQNHKGDYVVLLHGIARSSAHMQPLENFLKQKGYIVINQDYPSTKYKIEQLADMVYKQISPKLNSDNKVHFIGYSMGGLVACTLLQNYEIKNLGYVLQLAVPNQGSEVADFLENNFLYQKIYGPAGKQLTTNNPETKKLLGQINYPLGVIAGNSTIDPISSYIIDGDDDGKVSIKNTKIDGMTDHVIVNASHNFFPSNKDVHMQVYSFLKNDKFIKE